MIPSSWVKLVVVIATGVVLAARPLAAQVADTSAQAVQQEIAQQLAILTAPEVVQQQQKRDEAARRLVQAGAWNRLLEILRGTQPSAQLAIARAIADADRPDPRFIDDLAHLAPLNADLAEAAAFALTKYRDNAQALGWLMNLAGQQANLQQKQRLNVIRALGTLSDKDVARLLMDILRGDADLPRDAAAQALIEMTGLSQFGNDVSQWEVWWQSQRDRTGEQFRAERLADRDKAYQLVKARVDRLSREIPEVVFDAHRMITGEKEKQAYALRILKNAAPDIRAAGAELVKRKKYSNEPIDAVVLEQLRLMVGDSSPEVRQSVALAIQAINDPGAVPAILAQLQNERVPNVRAALINAVAPTNDVSAVKQLIQMLDDPTYLVVDAAGKALFALGGEIARDRDLTARTVKALVQSVERTKRLRGATQVRQSLVKAMIPLHDPDLYPTLISLLPETVSNTVEIRRAAIRALAGIDLSRLQAAPAAQMGSSIATEIAKSLRFDRQPGVQLEAAIALGIVGSQSQAEALYWAMQPTNVADPAINEAAWTSLSSLFEKFDVDALPPWSSKDRFNAPEKRLTVLLVRNRKLVAAARVEERAIVQNEIGGIYLEDLGKPEEAIVHLDGALTYWDTKPTGKLTAEGIQILLMRSYLRAGRFKDATQFAMSRILRDRQNQEPMGREIVRDVQARLDAKQPQKALELLDEARRNMRMEGYYKDQFEMLGNKIRGMIQNLLPNMWPQWWVDYA